MIIDKKLLNYITEQAKASDRLRKNYNLHDNLDAKAQRLFNALEPGTELPIHRHQHSAETYILLKGRMDVLFYDDHRQVVKRFALDLTQGNYGLHIPVGQWHGLEVYESTVIFEVKDGPYTPLTAENIML